MSYNIDTWKVKECKDLIIPVKALQVGEYFDRVSLNITTSTVRIKDMDGVFVEGRLEDGNLHVTKIECHGEGSGNTYHEVLLSALGQSTGTLVVSLVWAGGEDITRLIVKDGDVEEENIDI